MPTADAGHPWPSSCRRPGFLVPARPVPVGSSARYRVLRAARSRGNGQSSVSCRRRSHGAGRPGPGGLPRLSAPTASSALQLIAAIGGPETTWSVLGQSYGGFARSTTCPRIRKDCAKCSSPAVTPASERRQFYRATYPLVRARPEAFPHPRDVSPATSCSTCTMRSRCPPGRLTVRRFQQLGFLLGFDEDERSTTSSNRPFAKEGTARS